MKIEFLADGRADCPLIRLFEFELADIEKLRAACHDLAERRIDEFVLHDQPWVTSVGGCRFVWCARAHDVGVMLPSSGAPFVLEFSDEGWREIEDKLLPFLWTSQNRFNWLTNEGDVEVLFSHSGTW